MIGSPSGRCGPSQEYRAIVCGRVKEEGDTFSIEEPLDGKASRTDVKVLQVRWYGEVLPRNIWMPGIARDCPGMTRTW